MQALSLLLQDTVSMLDVFFDSHPHPVHAVGHKAAVDPKHAAGSCHDSSERRGSTVRSRRGTSSSSRSSSSSSSSSRMSAAEVAWQVAAAAGGAAWSLVLCGVSAAVSTNSANEPQFLSALAVQLALLATAVQGLQDSTQAALSDWAAAAASPASRLQQQEQQRQGAGLCAGSSTPQAAAALCSRLKQDLLAQVGEAWPQCHMAYV
jgi:hypothetical protein